MGDWMARSEGAIGPCPISLPGIEYRGMHESDDSRSSLTRRRFLRSSVAAAGGIAVVGLAACAPAGTARWTYAPPQPSSSPPGTPSAPAAAAAATASGSHVGHTAAASPGTSPGASASPMADHDANAKAVVDRFLGGEWQKVGPMGNQPLEPRIDGDTKVFELTVDRIQHRIDALKAPIGALGFNGVWPGPLLRVTEGDKVRAVFTNNLDESTGIHFHGQSLPNAMDGVPHITQDPILPGGSFSYEFVAKPFGSHMYHSHHNATDQVGRGLLGAFIVDPKDPALRYQVDQEVVWISNDALGGFTINGRGFPATAPIVAKLGQKVLIRFMNEGVMAHPWHLHGMPMRVVARDGYPLGGAEFTCDTLGVDPGSRWDVIVTCDNPGAWAFHCHILPHAEGQEGMFGMVTALIVQ
jgi:FtsP/CotA-like multicopper oxidase with cupredoxin domain